MTMDATRPADTLDLAVKFEDEPRVLSIADSEAFPELHAVWAVRSEMPAEILLALVEKDCGPFLQLLENAVRRQLRIAGLAEAPAGADAVTARVSESGETLFEFALEFSPEMRKKLGVLRNIDPAHPSVRDEKLDAELQYASFAVPETDLAGLVPGDAVLLPEVGSISPVLIVGGLFRLAQDGVTPWSDDGLLRVLTPESTTATLGELMDGAAPADRTPGEAEQLRLFRNGAAVATGRYGLVGDHPAMIVESLANT